MRAERDNDWKARHGGHEFVLLSNSTPAGLAAGHGEEMVARIARCHYNIGGTPVRVGASVGVSVLPGGGSFTELMKSADAAPYAAKSRGGSFCRVARDLAA